MKLHREMSVWFVCDSITGTEGELISIPCTDRPSRQQDDGCLAH